MSNRLSLLLTSILTTVLLVACNKAVPTGFWKDFKSDHLQKNISDQGPWGGHRAMYWKSSDENIFTAKQVIDFATKNGWELVDSSKFLADSLVGWTYGNKNIFPLSSEGFVPHYTMTTSEFEHFPRWTTSGLSVFAFKTGWVSIQPGTDNSNEINGFVTISDNGKEISVYHLWGE